jgi:hypothetical protein
MKNQEERWKKYSDSVELMKVRLRLIEKDEHPRWTRLVDRHHYLSSRLVGYQLRYVAELDGEWMALLSVGEASTHLEDRDRHIGWDNLQRGRRLRLIGQNPRFAILFDKAQHPNLASRIIPSKQNPAHDSGLGNGLWNQGDSGDGLVCRQAHADATQSATLSIRQEHRPI